MVATTTAARIVGPTDGKSGVLAAIGVRFMIESEEAGGRFSLVEHPMPPRALAAPLHRHSREDEYSFVLEGRMGAQLGEEIVYADAGHLVFKPRGQWHTFWNAGDQPCRILEVISPAGFERYFEELVDMTGPRTPETIAPIASRYGLEMRFETIPQLVAEHGLNWPGVTALNE
jgi:mannose-6-phosphate isomerase-like protein (cupin superfamily)